MTIWDVGNRSQIKKIVTLNSFEIILTVLMNFFYRHFIQTLVFFFNNGWPPMIKINYRVKPIFSLIASGKLFNILVCSFKMSMIIFSEFI